MEHPCAAPIRDALDLVNPALSPLRSLMPGVTPFRSGRRIEPPRYTPPHLPEGHARVRLSDDYYLGAQWDDFSEPETDNPAAVFDVPAELRDRWAAAVEAYGAMQDEIEELVHHRARDLAVGEIPAGWVRKGSAYQVQP